MINIIKKEIDVEESLRKKLEIICDFCNTTPTIINGSDKNKKNSSKASAKSNISGTTSKSNNAIQNAGGLTKVDNHDYEKDKDDFEIEI